jgi:P4 family phage/plasmid primase-like protien
MADENLFASYHSDYLSQRGVLLDEVAKTRGYRTVWTASELKNYGFEPAKVRAPALMIPVFNVRGERAFWLARPDSPRRNRDGKTVKFEIPRGTMMALDCHPVLTGGGAGETPLIGDPEVPLWITEGVPKADAALGIGLVCIALIGVWNWRGRNGSAGKTALPDWESIALNNRQVFVAFDSDVMQKLEVHKALTRLKAFLDSRGARVKVVYLEPSERGDKVGLDDFIASRQQAGLNEDQITQELKTLASDAVRRAPADQRTKSLKPGVLAQGVPGEFAQDAGKKLYLFEDGGYQPDAEEYVKQTVKGMVPPDKWSSHIGGETTEYIRLDAPHFWDQPPLDTLCLLNGILDLRTRRLDIPSAKFLSPVQLPVIYEPVATCPLWEEQIAATFPDDAAQVAWEIIAWLMLPNTSLQKALLLLGPGGTGKSTWLKAVTQFLGPQNVSSLTLQKLENNPFAVARLVGKLANVCADLPSTHLETSSTFKAITGGDMITGEYKFKDSFEFIPYARLVFSANQPPISHDATDAFFQRWIVMPFTRVWRGHADEIDSKTLFEAMSTPSELSGVLNKALVVLPKVMRSGITVTDTMKEAYEEFWKTTDPLAIWLAGNTVMDPTGIVRKGELIEEYNLACTKAGRIAPTRQAFGRELRRLRPHVLSGQRDFDEVGADGSVVKNKREVYLGIKLREQR